MHRSYLFAKLLVGVAIYFFAQLVSLAQESAAISGTGQKPTQQTADLQEMAQRKQDLLKTPPTHEYGYLLATEIRRKVVYRESITGVGAVDVEVSTAANGSVLAIRLVKSSGTPTWDEAVLNAIRKVDRFPLDGYGRVPPTILFQISPAGVGSER